MAKKKTKRTFVQQADLDVDITSAPSKTLRYNTRSSLTKPLPVPAREVDTSEDEGTLTTTKAKKGRKTTPGSRSSLTTVPAPDTTAYKHGTRSTQAKIQAAPLNEGLSGTSKASLDDTADATTLATTKVIKERSKTSKLRHSDTTIKAEAVTPQRNTQSKHAQAPVAPADEEHASDDNTPSTTFEHRWPRYKDDLPNAFNGEIDPSKDYISRMPAEVLDNILSYALLDHDPDRGVKKEKGEPERTHVLISLAAMSRTWYHATEHFSLHYLRKHRDALRWYVSDSFDYTLSEEGTGRRRSARLVDKPLAHSSGPVMICRQVLVTRLQTRWSCTVCHEFAGSRGTFANTVLLCDSCNRRHSGPSMTLTDALKDFDLRDYMILKSRKPGPRAKHPDLPTILYASYRKGHGFPICSTVTSFTFRTVDVEKIARMVHGDLEAHMVLKKKERPDRALRGRCKRVNDAKLKFHQDRVEVTTGQAAEKHLRQIQRLSNIGLDEEDDKDYCKECSAYHDREKYGLCEFCGDVEGRKDGCEFCWETWFDRQVTRRWG